MARTRAPAAGTAPDAGRLHRNEVTLVGRLPATPEVRTLPSGDEVVVLRLVVRRPAEHRPGPPGDGGAGRRAGAPVDTIDCVAWRAGVRRSLLAAAPGDVLEVQGALRRRFWRAGAGAVSRTEVELTRARRVRVP